MVVFRVFLAALLLIQPLQAGLFDCFGCSNKEDPLEGQEIRIFLELNRSFVNKYYSELYSIYRSVSDLNNFPCISVTNIDDFDNVIKKHCYNDYNVSCCTVLYSFEGLLSKGKARFLGEYRIQGEFKNYG